MKPNLKEIKEKANRINNSAKKLLKRDSLSPNLDLVFQVQNQIEIFKMLNQLKKQCRQQNLQVVMLTFVVHHVKSDSLDKTYKILKKSTDKLFRSQEFKKFLNLLGVCDQIKRLETDYSDSSGWHPHYHIIIVAENSIAVEFVGKYEKIFTDKYLKLCINSGMTCTNKTKEFMTESGFKITNNFEYLGYISDYKKLLKPRINNLAEKYFSPYLMSSYKGYESQFREFAKFLRNKKIFEFSQPSILGVPFNWKEIDKTKHLKPAKLPDLTNLQTTGYYKICPKRYWHTVFQFLPDRMIKHYCIIGSFDYDSRWIDWKKFKIWLCFIANIDWFNFYHFIKSTADNDIFSVKRRNEEVPNLVVQLLKSYKNFYYNLLTLDYNDPFLYLSCNQLIEKYENYKEMEELKYSWSNGKLSIES